LNPTDEQQRLVASNERMLAEVKAGPGYLAPLLEIYSDVTCGLYNTLHVS